MINKLVIIGNGFDLHFGLPTRVENFKNVLAKRKDYYGFNALNTLEGYGVDWSEYENSLADLRIDDVAIENIVFPDYSSDYESDRDYGITNMECYANCLKDLILSSLAEMVEDANAMIDDVAMNQSDFELIPDNSFVINFNYTSTVERLFGKGCYHIHGLIDQRQKLIFGYKAPNKTIIESELESRFEDDHDYYVDEQKKILVNFYKSFRKDIQLSKLKETIEPLANIEEVIVLGHSLGFVDKPYFEYIEKVLKPATWTVFYYDEKIIKQAEKYSFFDKIRFKKWL